MKNIIRQYRICFSFFAIAMLLLTGCGQDGPSPGDGGETSLPVTLSFRLPEARKAGFLSKPAVSNVDALEIKVRGEGMTEITERFSVSPGETVSHTLDIPVGPARIFAITVFDRGGNAIYGGESAPTDVFPTDPSEEGILVSIRLRPLRLDLPSELPKFSENYLMLDAPGTSSFVGSANSENYATTVGIPALGDRYLLSTNRE
ncbi:MAG: hypothetical protein ACE5F7_10900 [Nitrospiria bacterium]